MCLRSNLTHKSLLIAGLARQGDLLSVAAQKGGKDRGPQEAMLLGVQYRGSFQLFVECLLLSTTDDYKRCST